MYALIDSNTASDVSNEKNYLSPVDNQLINVTLNVASKNKIEWRFSSTKKNVNPKFEVFQDLNQEKTLNQNERKFIYRTNKA